MKHQGHTTSETTSMVTGAMVFGAAAGEGLAYNPGKISRQPNTLDCHRLILWARNTGDAARMKQRLMELYFTEGADLTDREVLVKAAADCGMDADLTRELLASDRDKQQVSPNVTLATLKDRDTMLTLLARVAPRPVAAA